MTKPGVGGRPCESPDGVPMRTILHINVSQELHAKLIARAKRKGVTLPEDFVMPKAAPTEDAA